MRAPFGTALLFLAACAIFRDPPGPYVAPVDDPDLLPNENQRPMVTFRGDAGKDGETP